jgi:hypothetical protein
MLRRQPPGSGSGKPAYGLPLVRIGVAPARIKEDGVFVSNERRAVKMVGGCTNDEEMFNP